MAKYQFYCEPNSERKQFTFLNMDSDDYLAQKQQLLSSGLEVEDDVIYASSDDEAVEKFRSNYVYVFEQYSHSYLFSALATLVLEGTKAIKSLLRP